jgi:hypothetical protein
MTRPPRVVGGLAIIYGYFKSMVQRNPRYGDAAFRRFLHRYQWACLFRGKANATARLNERQQELWDPSRSASAAQGLTWARALSRETKVGVAEKPNAATDATAPGDNLRNGGTK